MKNIGLGECSEVLKLLIDTKWVFCSPACLRVSYLKFKKQHTATICIHLIPFVIIIKAWTLIGIFRNFGIFGLRHSNVNECRGSLAQKHKLVDDPLKLEGPLGCCFRGDGHIFWSSSTPKNGFSQNDDPFYNHFQLLKSIQIKLISIQFFQNHKMRSELWVTQGIFPM